MTPWVHKFNEQKSIKMRFFLFVSLQANYFFQATKQADKKINKNLRHGSDKKRKEENRKEYQLVEKDKNMTQQLQEQAI